jgi:hypothetical protein
MTISSRRSLGFALAILAAGCGSSTLDATEKQMVEDGSQAMMATSQSISLASLVFDAVNMAAADPAVAAGQLAAATATCASYARDMNDTHSVDATLTGCTGPFQLTSVSGSVTVTFSAGAGGALHAVIPAVDLGSSSGTVVFGGTADITFPSATARNVVWQGTWGVTDAGGDAVAHTSDLQIDVDLAADCRTASGSTKTEVGSRWLGTTLSDYKVCRDATTGVEGCPSGSVVHTGSPSGRVITIDFDDSATALVTGPRGDTEAVTLGCTSIGR